MVGMMELGQLLDAIDSMQKGDPSIIGHMLHFYRDGSNPLRKLINQYNATIQLLAAPPDGEA